MNTLPTATLTFETDPELQRLRDQIRHAVAQRRPLCLRGHGSKDFYGGLPRGDILDSRALQGITSYEPSEMVITARAGTPLHELEAQLAESGQCLAFEPPRFGSADGASGGTLGGMVAAGLAGPARASVGSVRDFVLGALVLDGHGQSLRFGGQVMKNVAGYDVSRVFAGSMGVLGLICEVSLKVMPLPQQSVSVQLGLPQDRYARSLAQLIGQAAPVQASVWHQGLATLRFAGAPASIARALKILRVQSEFITLEPDSAQLFWNQIRDQTHAFFAPDTLVFEGPGARLWRISTPALAPVLPIQGTWLNEWHGALRWLRTNESMENVQRAAAAVGGSATIYRSAQRPHDFLPTPDPVVRGVHERLKATFDPAGVFNPGRLYSWL